MKDPVLTWIEFGKPASNVITTARNKHLQVNYEWQDVVVIPFEQAFTAKEKQQQLQDWKRMNHVREKVEIVKGEFMELDSTNMSHAAAYYKVTIKLPIQVAKRLQFDYDIIVI